MTEFSTRIRYWRMAGSAALVLALGLSVLLNPSLIVILNPVLAAVGAIATVLILPGWLLLGLVFDPGEEMAWPERLPGALVAGLGLLSLPVVLLLFWQTSLAWLVWVSVVLNLALGGLYLWRQVLCRLKAQETSQHRPTDSIQPLLLIAVLVAGAGALLLFVATASTWSFGDNWSYLAYIRHYLDWDLVPHIDPISGEKVVSARVILNSWWVLQAFLMKVAAVAPVDLYTFYLPPFFMLLSLLALYGLARTLFHNRNTALLAVLVQVVYSVSSLGSHDWIGRGFFDRILEDKFLIWLILLPVSTTLMLKYLASGRRRQLLPLALSVVALTLTHPIGLALVGLSWAAFAVVSLVFDRRRIVLVRFAFIFMPVLLLLLVPLAQRQMQGMLGTAFDYSGGEDIQFALSRTRLWILSGMQNRYIAHPQLVAQPLTILAILLTPLLIRDLRHSLAARYLFGNMAGILLVLYNPVTAPLLGKLITPWMLWRVAWLLPVALTIAFFLARLEKWLSQQRRTAPLTAWVGPLLLVCLAAVLLWPYTAEGMAWLRERRDHTMRPAERALLVAVRKQAAPGSVILARSDMNTYLPAFASQVRVLTFRWVGEPEVRADVEWFYQARLLDTALLDILKRRSVTYIVLERRHSLAFQLDLRPALFARRYQNSVYSLYEVKPGSLPDRAIIGNTYLLQGDWQQAETEYQMALAVDPTDPLAYSGLGEVYRRQSQPARAVAAYHQALAAAPGYIPARLGLAEMYAEQGQVAEASHQYELADQQLPGHPAVAEGLGDLYRDQLQPEQALVAYRQAIDTPLDSPAYAIALGDLLGLKRMPDQAVIAYQQALVLKPPPPTAASAYAGLGRAYLMQARLEEAETAYRRAVQLAPDNSFYYIKVQDLLLDKEIDEGLELYRAAIRFNLNSAWPHLELGKIYLGRVE